MTKETEPECSDDCACKEESYQEIKSILNKKPQKIGDRINIDLDTLVNTIDEHTVTDAEFFEKFTKAVFELFGHRYFSKESNPSQVGDNGKVIYYHDPGDETD